MKNALVRIIILVSIIGCIGYLAYRLGVSNCREDIANEKNEIQQVVQKSDRTITERVLSDSHTNNLRWLVNHYKRAN